MNAETKEVLLILQEECAEVSQAISKCFRFGPDQVGPTSNGKTNIGRVEEELGDLVAMVELLTDLDIGVTTSNIELAKKLKFEKLKKWSTLTINK